MRPNDIILILSAFDMLDYKIPQVKARSKQIKLCIKYIFEIIRQID